MCTGCKKFAPVCAKFVDLDAFDLTPLPDCHRLIAPLKGEMVLTHDGGAETHSQGWCVDFNLVLRKGACQGR